MEQTARLIIEYQQQKHRVFGGYARKNSFTARHWAGMALEKSGGDPVGAITWTKKAKTDPHLLRAGFRPGAVLAVLDPFVTTIDLSKLRKRG